MSDDRFDNDLQQVEEVLGYRFKDRSLLITALTRRSYWHENRPICDGHNERMEFLGDAVLGLAVAHILYGEFPEDEEGDLQKKRASLVNRAALARLMRQLDLSRFIRMGRGDEMSGCRSRDSVLADTLEALVAAVYLDSGFPEAYELILRHFYPLIDRCSTRDGMDDFKSLLQERVQSLLGITPTYHLVDEWGDEHAKTFSVAVCFDRTVAGRGEGRNKKEAAQNAARVALDNLADMDTQ